MVSKGAGASFGQGGAVAEGEGREVRASRPSWCQSNGLAQAALRLAVGRGRSDDACRRGGGLVQALTGDGSLGEKWVSGKK